MAQPATVGISIVKFSLTWPSRYVLIVLLPVAMITVLGAVLNFLSFSSLQDAYLTAEKGQRHAVEHVTAATRFNQDIAAIQLNVGAMLERAAAGKLDEAEVYRLHTDMVNQLASLSQRLPSLSEHSILGGQAKEAQADFETYRSFIIMATDLATIDPPGAMRHAYRAANAYVSLSQRTSALAEAIAI